MVLVQADFNSTEINARINKLRDQIQEVVTWRKKFFGCNSECLPEWFRQDRPKELNALVENAQDHVRLRNDLMAELQSHIESIEGTLMTIDEQIDQFALPKFKSPVKKKS